MELNYYKLSKDKIKNIFHFNLFLMKMGKDRNKFTKIVKHDFFVLLLKKKKKNQENIGIFLFPLSYLRKRRRRKFKKKEKTVK